MPIEDETPATAEAEEFGIALMQDMAMEGYEPDMHPILVETVGAAMAHAVAQGRWL